MTLTFITSVPGLVTNTALSDMKANNVSATRRYLLAEEGALRAAERMNQARIHAARAVVSHVRLECPGVVRPHVENRSTLEVNAEIAVMVAIAVVGSEESIDRQFISSVGRLRWSDGRVNTMVQRRLTGLEEQLASKPRDLCTDVKMWSRDGYHTVSFKVKRVLRRWDAIDRMGANVRTLLAPYEINAERPLLRVIQKTRVVVAARVRATVGYAWRNVEQALGIR